MREFESANMVLATLERADFSNENLSKANLSRASMLGVTLRGATMIFTDLQDAYLDGG